MEHEDESQLETSQADQPIPAEELPPPPVDPPAPESSDEAEPPAEEESESDDEASTERKTFQKVEPKPRDLSYRDPFPGRHPLPERPSALEIEDQRRLQLDEERREHIARVGDVSL